ncbi:MAG: hypothetical protein ACHQJ5_00085 [Vicinamibacteria bacterium]
MTDEAEHHHLHHTPTSELAHADKIARQQRHIRILTGVLVLALAALAYAAAFDLDSSAEWIVFGMIIFTVAGAMIAVHKPDSSS